MSELGKKGQDDVERVEAAASYAVEAIADADPEKRDELVGALGETLGAAGVIVVDVKSTVDDPDSPPPRRGAKTPRTREQVIQDTEGHYAHYRHRRLRRA